MTFIFFFHLIIFSVAVDVNFIHKIIFQNLEIEESFSKLKIVITFYHKYFLLIIFEIFSINMYWLLE